MDFSLRNWNQIFVFIALLTGMDQFDGIFEMYPTSIKKLYVVDGGLSFNSPFPLLLRPQRGVDLILSFDFSARPTDTSPPFKVRQEDGKLLGFLCSKKFWKRKINSSGKLMRDLPFKHQSGLQQMTFINIFSLFFRENKA